MCAYILIFYNVSTFQLIRLSKIIRNQIFTYTYDSILWYTNVRSLHVSIIYLSWSERIEFFDKWRRTNEMRKVQKGTIHYGTMVEPWYRYKIMEHFLSLSATGRAIRNSAPAQLRKIMPRLNDFIEIRTERYSHLPRENVNSSHVSSSCQRITRAHVAFF